MHLAHDIGMGEIGLRAPGVATHRHAAALDVGSRAAIEDDGFAAGELVPRMCMSYMTDLQPSARAARNARMWNSACAGA